MLADLAPAPLHLPYALWAMALLALAALLGTVPETVTPPVVRPPYRPQRAAGPPRLRRPFRAAAAAAIVSFGLFGLFAALGSAFVQNTLGSSAHVLGGLSTTASFGAAALVQALVRGPARPRAVPLGASAVAVGLAVVVAGTWTASLPLFLGGEVVAGGGAGVLFAAASRTVAAMRRGAVEKAGVRPEDDEAVRLTAAPKGIAAADMTGDQQERLRALLDVYIGRIPDELAEREAAKFAGDKLREVHFAWAGGVEPGQPHYYRMQGPRLLAEYDNTQRDVNHVHSAWRDPDGDFDDDVLARHLARHHPPAD